MRSSRNTLAQLTRIGPLAVCGAVLVWHAVQYGFVTDDAYISFVYSRNLAEHGALVFNPGLPPVEGYTNFLWTSLLGLLMVAGLPPQVMSLVLGIGFGLGTLVLAFLLVEYLLAEPNSATSATATPATLGWAYMAPAALSLSAAFACWCSGGLETQMFTFWVAIALFGYVKGDRDPRWLRRTGIFLALAAMTRPEGLLLTGLFGLHRLAVNVARERRVVPSRDELVMLAGFLALWAPWYAWRWWYYGYPFPNTYYVKASGEPPPGYSAALVQNGLHYVWSWAVQSGAIYLAPVLVASLAIAPSRSPRRQFGTLAIFLAAVYLGYTVRVGGDFMGLHRFVMPLFFLAAVALALGLRLLASLVPAGRSRVIAAGSMALAVLGLHGWYQIGLTVESLRWGNWQSDRGIDTPAFLRIYTLDRAAIGEHMRDCFRPDDFSIVGGAGAQPYHGRMRGIDVFGLVSERIAHEVAPTRPRAGHNKWAPDGLLLSYDPEFVFSCYSIHTHPRQPRFNCNPRFWLKNGYQMVTLHIPTLRQDGQYYSFFRRKDRDFQCPGLVE